MGVYLEKIGLWGYVWESPGRRKHVSFSLEGGIRVDLGEMHEYPFLLLSLQYYHMTIIGHIEGREGIPSITVAMTGLSLCVYV